jgi:lipopolysaccharide transport system ATP-binding protein
MSSETGAEASSGWAIEARDLGKCYSLYERSGDRLRQLLWGRWRSDNKPYFRDFWALKGVNFAIRPGEVVGIVGRNGAGKSTLLQMVCGTLAPTTGDLEVKGRVAALLELGAGFNPDFTGLENIYMNAAILGLNQSQVDARLEGILAFADIGDFIRQPVKTYSSGMYMRLAFAVATSVEPDILVIDEALSVGDGAFARKSFDRIMGLKDAGKTILFCSHSMYQVEALCSRALWIDGGTLRMLGSAAEVTSAYQASLNVSLPAESGPRLEAKVKANTQDSPPALVVAPPQGSGRINSIFASAGGMSGRELDLVSAQSDLHVTVDFSVDPTLPAPSLAFGFSDSNNLTVASVLSNNDGVELHMNDLGHGIASVVFPKIPLLKGRYTVTGFLLCEKGLHLYEQIERSLVLNVTQKGLEQGLVTLPHEWLPRQ